MEAPKSLDPNQPELAVAFEDGWNNAAISDAELSAIERLLGEELFNLLNA